MRLLSFSPILSASVVALGLSAAPPAALAQGLPGGDIAGTPQLPRL